MDGKDDEATDEHSGVETDEHSGEWTDDDLVLRLIPVFQISKAVLLFDHSNFQW